MINIFLDDVRSAPSSWLRTRTADETITMLKHYEGGVNTLSLDHDLGLEKTGYDVLLFLEQQLFEYNNKDIIPKQLKVHSANPVGIDRMNAAINNINRRR